ncbi:MAG: hypothetical protein BWY41_00755 [Candidatus Atribacteria bacterium ADurb.Bin276]|jgi:hypothetical protein|uniref:Preprotein translocase subunit SecB n=1 Tax=Candidatus Atribacter allofermentans TaxID=1852833 RepID=A0A1V5SZF4_9BACT|nr:MAG: hypothetical protein BWY41_00755 [Candidatus Atribacteria bacterium ADurb.Bin276]
MNKETFQQFKIILDNVELEDINISKIAYKIEKMPESGDIAIGLGKKISEPEINQNKMFGYVSFSISIEQNKEKIMSFQVGYKLTFNILSLEILNKSFENAEAKKMFIEYQLPKFAWPFLREDFHTACTKVGMRPITLKMMK